MHHNDGVETHRYDTCNTRSMIYLEVCANSVTSAIAAQDGGAYRVELCDNLHEGGTTPSSGQILLARKLLNIKLNVLIRPRAGDFLYSDLEYEVMQEDIKHCIEADCDGIVIGILKPDGSVDKERCAPLVRMAKASGLSTTFHRAFDMCADLYKSLEEIIDLGFDRILTSGGKSTAMEGITIIRHLVELAADRISIMPGAGITETNAVDLVRFTRVSELHASARANTRSKMQYHNDHILLSNQQLNEMIDSTNAERVKAILKAVNVND